MKVFDSPEAMYNYKLLPGFAQFMQDNHLATFVELQYNLSYRVNLPLL